MPTNFCRSLKDFKCLNVTIADCLDLRSLPGNISGLIISGISVYGFHQYYDSTFRTVILALPIWFSWLGVIWFTIWLWRVKHEILIQQDEELTIRIKNLTKIYDAPGRFINEWRKKKRRDKRIFDPGKLPRSPTDLKEALIWKGCIFGLLIYLHFFLTNHAWLMFLSIFTWSWLFLILTDFKKRFQIKSEKNEKSIQYERWLRWLKHIISIGILIYIYFRTESIVVIATNEQEEYKLATKQLRVVQ